MNIVTTSKRGQIVIPKAIRKKLNITEGTKLLIKEYHDHAVLTPLPDNPSDYFCGIFKKKKPLTRALLNERKKDQKIETQKSS